MEVKVLLSRMRGRHVGTWSVNGNRLSKTVVQQTDLALKQWRTAMTTNVDRAERFDPFVHEHEALHHTLGDLRWLLKERRSPEKFASTFAEFADHVSTLR